MNLLNPRNAPKSQKEQSVILKETLPSNIIRMGQEARQCLEGGGCREKRMITRKTEQLVLLRKIRINY